jgi:drug/metabolite transporter (DMT)-like permease
LAFFLYSEIGLIPSFAVFVGWLLAAEPISMRLLTATALILVAIFLIQRGNRHNGMQAEARGTAEKVTPA